MLLDLPGPALRLLAEAKMRRAGFLGHHPPRDKEHHLASRKCRRESTPQTARDDVAIGLFWRTDRLAARAPSDHVKKKSAARSKARAGFAASLGSARARVRHTKLVNAARDEDESRSHPKRAAFSAVAAAA